MEPRLPKRSRPHTVRGPARARPPRARLAPRVHPPAPPPRTPSVLRLTRHVIPALIVLAGVVSMAIGTTTSLIGGAALVGAGAASWLISWLYRIGVEGDRAREREEQARGYFERHGRWPES